MAFQAGWGCPLVPANSAVACPGPCAHVTWFQVKIQESLGGQGQVCAHFVFWLLPNCPWEGAVIFPSALLAPAAALRCWGETASPLCALGLLSQEGHSWPMFVDCIFVNKWPLLVLKDRSIFLKLGLFLFSVRVLRACVCSMCAQSPQIPEEGVGTCRAGVAGGCEPLRGAGNGARSSAAQPVP